MAQAQGRHDLIIKCEVAEHQGCQGLVVDKLAGVGQAGADLQVSPAEAAEAAGNTAMGSCINVPPAGDLACDFIPCLDHNNLVII